MDDDTRKLLTVLPTLSFTTAGPAAYRCWILCLWQVRGKVMRSISRLRVKIDELPLVPQVIYLSRAMFKMTNGTSTVLALILVFII